MIDIDTLLLDDENIVVKEALEEYKKGEIFTLDDIVRSREG